MAKNKPVSQGAQPSEKKAKRDPATTAKGELVTFLNRVKEGKYRKRATEEDKSEADQCLQQYHSLAQEDKANFALSYMQNKDQKTFQWARDFLQKVSVSKNEEEEKTDKYLTRSSCPNSLIALKL